MYLHGWQCLRKSMTNTSKFAYQVIDMKVVPNGIYGSEKNSVGYFQRISDMPTIGSYCTLDKDDVVKAKALEDIRYTIKCAIEHLENGTDEEEEETEDE